MQKRQAASFAGRTMKREPAKRKYTVSDSWGLTKYKSGVSRELQRAIRMEHADDAGNCQCVCCGRVQHYTDMDCGHFIDGKANAIRFDERGMFPCCVNCNRHLNGNKEAYGRFLLKHSGQAVIDDLLRLRNTQMKITRADLESMRRSIKTRIKAQDNRLKSA